MALLFADFHEAQRIGSGHLLASCLIPVDISPGFQRLRSFAQLSNYSAISADVRYRLFQSPEASYRPPKNEATVWIDIFVALWTTVKELGAIEDSLHQSGWGRVFDAYKELTNLLIRGYSNGFQAWTVPCLYTTGKYLRAFAIKADAEAKSKDGDSFGDGFSDDIMGNFGKNEKLEQAAWVINRMFTTCLSDR
jgi:COP9 signalosome complex subunit 12